jgi:hypothetical protein
MKIGISDMILALLMTPLKPGVIDTTETDAVGAGATCGRVAEQGPPAAE